MPLSCDRCQNNSILSLWQEGHFVSQTSTAVQNLCQVFCRQPSSALMSAVRHRDEKQIDAALENGAFPDSDVTNQSLHFYIITSQYGAASFILTRLSESRNIILEFTPLDRDTTTIILEYYGNVHHQITFGWSKVSQLGWTNSMYDLKLLQLLIFHGPRNVIHRGSPDFGEHCFVSAIKNNAQLIIKILLCIYYDELGNNVLNSIKNDLNKNLQDHLNRVKDLKHKQEIFKIFEQYENDFDVFQQDVLSMILSDQFGRFEVLASYVKERKDLYPILNDDKFQQLVKQMTKESKEELRIHLSTLKEDEEAKKEEKEDIEQQKKLRCFDDCLLQ